ncbi:MAG TPA: class I SAM-dependent methyltransferase [Chitinophagales bacterium]|nr:class I SAM-dependent methyltransferase [Chitinophagales bacterium]
MIPDATTVYDYDKHGKKYISHRCTDPRIATQLYVKLRDAKTILNVGAGAGSYEPEDKYVVAVEPSQVMRAQRIGKVPAINAIAEALPFDDNAFDASMAILTVHHWNDKAKGLKEMRRVTKGPVVIFTFDPFFISKFWLYDYVPQIVETDRKRFPPIEFYKECLGGKFEVEPIRVPMDCVDGFQEAFYARPEAFLDESVRRSQSAWDFLPVGVEAEAVEKLKADLES